MKPLTDYIPVDPREGSTIRCYRYLGSHWMDSLTRMELKTADIDDFNDIFDGRGSTTGEVSLDVVKRHIAENISENVPGMSKDLLNRRLEHEDDKVLRELYSNRIKSAIINREQMHECRIICFSDPQNCEADRLMWSHYANHWNGVRLGFDLLYDNHSDVKFVCPTTPFTLDCVRYDDARPIMDLSKLEAIVGDTYFTSCFRSALLTKSKAWQYENEWRMFVLKNQAEIRYVDNAPMYFWKFHPQLLKRVDIGPLVEEDQRNELVMFLSREYPHVEITQVTLNEKDYGFEYRPIIKVL